MVVSGLGLLLGGRADPRSVRGSQNARVEGRFKIENPELLQQASQAGGELDDDELIVARHVTAAEAIPGLPGRWRFRPVPRS